jgi:hypothetical protein
LPPEKRALPTTTDFHCQHAGVSSDPVPRNVLCWVGAGEPLTWIQERSSWCPKYLLLDSALPQGWDSCCEAQNLEALSPAHLFQSLPGPSITAELCRSEAVATSS